MNDKPTEPGFYWYQARHTNERGQIVVFRWQVVEVDGDLFYYARSALECHVDLTTGIWGPKLKEPTQ